MTYKLEPHDYDLKYSDTIIGYRFKGKVLPFSISHTDNQLRLNGRVLKEGEWKKSRISVNNKQIVTDVIPNGAINTEGGSVIFIKRKIIRQWRTSLYNKIVEIIDPFVRERESLNLPIYQGLNNMSLLRSIMNNEYKTKDQCLESVLSGDRLAMAWNNSWFIGKRFDVPQVFFNIWPIGPVDDNGVVSINQDLKFVIEEAAENGLEIKVVE